jgi:hypothetical protein
LCSRRPEIRPDTGAIIRRNRPGWHLSQPEPGILTWTTPSGCRYSIDPEPYPS